MKHFGYGLLLMMVFVTGLAAASEEVKVTGKTIWGDTKKKINYLEGDVRLVQGSTIITTEKARIDLERKLAYFENKVKLVHPEATIESESLEYDLKKKVGTFKKNIVFERKQIKATDGKADKDPFKMNAVELYFETDTKNFIAQNSKIVHQDFTGEADLIEYNDLLQELTLKGNAKLTRPKGEVIKGKLIKIGIPDKSFIVTDDVSIEFEVEEESEPKRDEKKNKAKIQIIRVNDPVSKETYCDIK